nr:hypothetical protein [Tanacetum cinerariifolium]
MYYKKNLNFVVLIWEDLAYQIDNKDLKKHDKMFYPRFTKIIIHHFLEKDKSISMRNRMFMHTARDDSLLGTIRFISRHEDTQIYGHILPEAMTNQAMLDSPAKAKKDVPTTKPKPSKEKAPVKAIRGKGLNVLSKVALSEDAQLKVATKRSKKDFHISQESGSESLDANVLAKSSSQPKSTYETAATLSEFELTKILMDEIEENKSYLRANYKKELYDALVKSYNTDKDLFYTYGEVFSLKKGRDDKDKDQDPSVGSDRGTKTRGSSKEAESSKDSRSKEGKSSSSSKGTSRSHHKSTNKSTHAEEPSHTVDDSKVRQHQEFDTSNNDEQPDEEAALRRVCDATRAENPPALFDELIDTSFDFSAFVLNRINILNLTQELLVGPTFNLLKGTCKSLTELEYHFEKNSKATTERLDWHNPEAKLTRLTIMKWYDYGYLDEFEVRREGQQPYTFKEGDFPRLHLQDIEDVLLLLVQQKMTNLKLEEHCDLNVALHTFRQDLRKRTAYSAYSDPQGVIYVDQNNINRLMRTDELHKFNDGTLDFVWIALYDIASGIRMKYMPKKN